MITAKADRVIMEDYNHRKWIVYAKQGPVTHKRRIYKSYDIALKYAGKLMDYYQVNTLTEIRK